MKQNSNDPSHLIQTSFLVKAIHHLCTSAKKKRSLETELPVGTPEQLQPRTKPFFPTGEQGEAARLVQPVASRSSAGII